jgi:hypothetical protein
VAVKRFGVVLVLAGALSPVSGASGQMWSQAGCPNAGGGSCRGVLKAGTYSTVKFQPKLTYTVPAGGWANYEDNPEFFSLAPPHVGLAKARNAVDDIMVVTAVQAAAMNCRGTAANVSQTAKAIAHWLAHHRGLSATAPRRVTIGGLRGYELSVAITPTGGVRCGGVRSVPVIMALAAPQEQGVFMVAGSSDHALIYLLTSEGGLPLAIVADSNGPHGPSLAADAKVIKHFHFSGT